jgi:DMSO/TMAO reductase YedYZ molybdopterin-dependent catalytic subunit
MPPIRKITTRNSTAAAPFRRTAFLMASAAALLLSLGFLSYGQRAAIAQDAKVTGPTELKIAGTGSKPLVLTQADLKKAPRTTLRVLNTHNNKTEVYEGVPLAELLKMVGVPQGDQIKGPWMTATVLAEAADNYSAVFSLAELDPGFLDSEVLVADTLDGAPLSADEGPFKLVAPHDKRPARWVRMLKSITIVHPSDK